MQPWLEKRAQLAASRAQVAALQQQLAATQKELDALQHEVSARSSVSGHQCQVINDRSSVPGHQCQVINDRSSMSEHGARFRMMPQADVCSQRLGRAGQLTSLLADELVPVAGSCC